MELVELKANVRTTTGKGPARTLRREGRFPAILYGPETEATMVSVGIRDFELAMKKSRIGQLLVNLVIQNGQETTRPAMLKELQTHPLSRDFLHADFYQISMDRKIRIKVPITTRGKAKGVEEGGMLQIIRRQVEILCLPNEIPDVIELDITDLDIGDSIHVKEIPVEGNIEIPAEVNFTILTILSPKGTKTPEEEAAEAEAAAAAAEAEATAAS